MSDAIDRWTRISFNNLISHFNIQLDVHEGGAGVKPLPVWRPHPLAVCRSCYSHHHTWLSPVHTDDWQPSAAVYVHNPRSVLNENWSIRSSKIYFQCDEHWKTASLMKRSSTWPHLLKVIENNTKPTILLPIFLSSYCAYSDIDVYKLNTTTSELTVIV